MLKTEDLKTAHLNSEDSNYASMCWERQTTFDCWNFRAVLRDLILPEGREIIFVSQECTNIAYIYFRQCVCGIKFVT